MSEPGTDIGNFELDIHPAPVDSPGDEITVPDYFEHVASYQARLFDASAAYNQVIILGAYAAFFAIWSAFAHQIDRKVMLVAGGLMAISLVIYVAWTVLQMFTMHAHAQRMLGEIAQGREDFYARIGAAEAEGAAVAQRVSRWWKPVVYSAGLAGLAAALLVAGNAFWLVATT